MNLSNRKPKVIYYSQCKTSRAEFEVQFGAIFDIAHCQIEHELTSQLREQSEIAALIVESRDHQAHQFSEMFSLAKNYQKHCLTVLVGSDFALDTIMSIIEAKQIDLCLKKPIDAQALFSKVVAAQFSEPKLNRLNSSAPPQKPVVLIVDDEVIATKYLKKQLLQLQQEYEVETAENVASALKLLETQEVAVVISDQRMPGTLGQAFLKQLKQHHPKTIRILTSAYSEIDVALGAMNESKIFQYLTKPWSADAIHNTIKIALEVHYNLLKEAHKAQEDMTQKHRAILAARLERVKKALHAIVQPTVLEHFFHDLQTLTTHTPNSTTVRASVETEIELRLVEAFSTAVKSQIAQIDKRSCSVEQFTQAVQKHLENERELLTGENPVVSLACSALDNLILASGNEAQFHSELHSALFTVKSHGSLKLYKHLLSPLTQINDKILSYQVSLLLLYEIVFGFGGKIVLKGSEQDCQLVFEIPTTGQDYVHSS